MNGKYAGDYISIIFKVAISLVVALFMASHSINGFEFMFGENGGYQVWFAFGLTGGALIAYIPIFKFAKDELHKTIALCMLVVSLVGELLAFGFGMKVESYKSAGITFTVDEIQTITEVFQILGALHGLAMVGFVIGHDIADLNFSFPKKSSSTSAISNNPLTLPRTPSSSVNQNENLD